MSGAAAADTTTREAIVVPRANACLSCGSDRVSDILTLGNVPLPNAYPEIAADRADATYPLDLALCETCGLVQLRHVVPPAAMFSEYLYFSSFSSSMLKHAEGLAQAVIADRRLDTRALVVEVASNDGYLLQYFKAAGVPVLGIEPAANIAAVAREQKGIPTLVEFFGRETAARLAAEGKQADVILGLNVMAHVPDINGFVAGLKTLLKPEGVAVIEAPYVRDMVEHAEFDTIYHEHLFYFSVSALAAAVERHGLVLQRVDRVPVHGGSLRVFIGRGDGHGPSARALLDDEQAAGLTTPAYYAGFRQAVERIRTDLVTLLGELRAAGKTVAGYGAAAKATVLLNYCGLSAESLDFIADRSPHKQGRRIPGTAIPIVPPDDIDARRPDYLLLFVWNIKDEVMRQQAAFRQGGGRFIVAVPEVRVE